jgi:hypothetical protein
MKNLIAVALLFFAVQNGFSQSQGTSALPPPDQETAPIPSPFPPPPEIPSTPAQETPAKKPPSTPAQKTPPAAKTPSTPAQKTPPAAGTPSTPAAKTPAAPVWKPPAALSEQDIIKTAWKNKRWYLGALVGGGNLKYRQEYQSYDGYSYHTEYEYTDYGLFAAGAQIELSIASWLALEFDLTYASTFGYGDFPIMPLLVKIGGRPGQAEIFANVGYTIGAGFTAGGTLGFHAGPGVLFGEVLFMLGNDDLISGNIFTGFVGYKVGLGDKKR